MIFMANDKDTMQKIVEILVYNRTNIQALWLVLEF